MGGDWRHAEVLTHFASGPAEVRADDHGSALIEQVAQSGEGGADAAIIGHGAVPEGHVEIDAQKNAAAARVEVADRPFPHEGMLLSLPRPSRPCPSPVQERLGVRCRSKPLWSLPRAIRTGPDSLRRSPTLFGRWAQPLPAGECRESSPAS